MRRLPSPFALALLSSASCLIDWDKLDPDNAEPAVGGSGGTVVTGFVLAFLVAAVPPIAVQALTARRTQ